MDILFVPVFKKNFKISQKHLDVISKLKNSKIFYSIQYKILSEKLYNELKKTNKSLSKPRQVLGCSILSESELKNIKNIILISSGRFHALNILRQFKIPVYIYNGESIEKISIKEIEKINKKTQAKILKFLNENKVGILVSLKPGQENLNSALQLQENLKKINKKPFIFIADNLNINELENFPLNLFINTACSAIHLDSNKIIDIRDIQKYLK